MTIRCDVPLILLPGLLVTLYLTTIFVWNVLVGFMVYLLPSLKTKIGNRLKKNSNNSLKEDFSEKYGSWAVVTGSTDGIGKAYAKELAKRGMNIVLISRSPERLNKAATEISTQFNVKTKIIVADFSKGSQIYEEIFEELKNIEIGILVNNVGVQYTYPTYLDEVSTEDLWKIINVNVGATTMMTRLLLPQMTERKKGAIVNVSSSAEYQPLPFMTVYAATKVYLKSFTDALRVEYSSKGLTIQNLAPSFVNTKMNAFSYRLQKSSIFVPDAETYAESAVNTLGCIHNSTGYWMHEVQLFFMQMTPEWFRMLVGGTLNKIFRRDYLDSIKNYQVK